MRCASRGLTAEPDVAGVGRAGVVDDVLAAEGGADRQPAVERPARERARRAVVPRPAADEHERPLRAAQHRLELGQRGRGRARAQRPVAGRVGHVGAAGQHVLGQREHDRAGPPARRDRVGAREHLGDARGVVELERPLRHRAEHGLVVELLEGLAPALRARDLADEQDQRRRVLARGVDRRSRRASRPARA